MMKPNLPEELRRLLPLTPAAFYILFALADGEKHGYAIMREMSALSPIKFRMGPGQLYTTLQRLLDLAVIYACRKRIGNRSRESSRLRRLANFRCSGCTPEVRC